MSNKNVKKPYNSTLGNIGEFYVPHPDANHLNAKDVVHSLLTQAINTSIATWNCFEDGEKLIVRDDIVSNLIWDIQTKLEMIEKILPLAFDNKGDKA